MFDVFHKLPVSHDLDDGKIRSRDVIVDTQVKFSTLLLEPQIHDGLAKCGYIHLSPIQQNALPLVLTGSSIIAHAKSGTGKTLIYVLPILNDFVKRKLNGLHCLVLAPTREIAKQIYDVFQNVACYVKGLQIEYFIGGTPLDMDVIKCMNCHLAIGAPGRIKHMIDLGFLKTANLEFLVLDEVDALFDHKEYAVEDIISTLPPPKQLIVCTATFSSKVGDLVKSVVPNVKYTSANKLDIEEVSNISNMLIAVKQYVAPVRKDSSSMDAMRKREKLVEILKKFNFDQCFIFVNYMTLVRSIYNHLISQNFSASWICSDQNQSSRINTINKLKMNHCKILVTTDLAARGIDVHKVNLVINLGLPCPPEIYIHRMGRAGRYGSEGAVITILSEGEEITTFTKMISVITTDPIDIHILPEQIDTTVSNLDIIQCLPTEGSISVDEFSFKRQMKDNLGKTSVKIQNDKKTKKKKRKGANASKSALQNSITDHLSSVYKNDVKMANHEVDDPISDEVVNERIKQFSQSLTDFLVAGEPTPEWNSLKCLFDLRDDPTTTVESFTFIQNPPANLLTYATRINQINEFIDEQIVPCSVDEFLSLVNRGITTFGHHSPGLCSLLKEISAKIERPARQRLNVGNSVASSDKSSYDSENSETSGQVSCTDVTSLSKQFLETMISDGNEKNFFGRTVKKNNAYPSSKKSSRNFSLAEEFSNAMKNYGTVKCSSSSRQSTSVDTSKSLPESDFRNTAEKFEIMSPKRFFNNSKRLNSEVENEKFLKETDSEMRQSKPVCNEIERPYRSTNAFQDSVVANICSLSTFEEQNISPNHVPRDLSHADQPAEDKMRLTRNETENRIEADKAECILSLSDQFSLAVSNFTQENGPRNSSKMTWTSSTDISSSQNQSNSIVTNDQLASMRNETHIEAKYISKDFNLSDQFLNDVGTSLVQPDSKNQLKKSKTSPLQSPENSNHCDQFYNGSTSKNEIGGKRVSTSYSSSNISLSDQLLASVNHSDNDLGEPTFDHERQTKCNILENPKKSLNADSPSQNLFCITDALSFKTVPKSADLEISTVNKRNAEKMSQPVAKSCVLSDQFLSAFESGECFEITSNILDSSNQRSVAVDHSLGYGIPASISNIEEVSGRSFNSAKFKGQSKCVSVPDHQKATKSASHLAPVVEFQPKLTTKTMLVPEIETKSNISTVLEMNNTSCSVTAMKNANSLSFSDNEPKEESSPFISNFQQNLAFDVEIASDSKSNRVRLGDYRSEYISERRKNYGTTAEMNKPENRLASRFTSDRRAVRDETCDGNVTNSLHKPNFGTVRRSENYEPNNNTVPISFKDPAPGSKVVDSDVIIPPDRTNRLNLLDGRQTAVTLPSLRSHVSAQQERKIWQHHFAFIRRHSISRSQATARQWQ